MSQAFLEFFEGLLDNNHASSISPTFSSQEAYTFFSEQYSAQPHSYSTPPRMPSPAGPKHAMPSVDPVTREELLLAIKRSRSSSASCLLDQIPYQVFKKCPSLAPALLDLFNTILSEKTIPSNWKITVFRLIGKSAAVEDSHSPNNFRPKA